MRTTAMPQTCPSSAMCAQCGTTLDSKYFDESNVTAAPSPGGIVVLARFELPPQYCGVLEYFSQFTDAFANDPSRVRTPGLEWAIVVNSRPLFPYLRLRHLVNPWGYGSFPVSIRLDDSATVEFVVRHVPVPPGDLPEPEPLITRVGGRIVGRYWYNADYGDVVPRTA